MDIDKISYSEWISYLDNKAGQVKLIPTEDCSSCDVNDDYTCFFCELEQIYKDDEKYLETIQRTRRLIQTLPNK